MIEVRCPAKINWTLRITGRRADGYHDLETVFQTISLHDTLRIVPSARTTLHCDDPDVPRDESNLILRAAAALQAPPAEFRLVKRIPVQGGLGGGSSNAASALMALDQLFELRTPPARMAEIALRLGSDVPFFLTGGTAYATGRGESLVSLASMAGIPLAVVVADERVSTRAAFAEIRHYSEPIGREAAQRALGERPELLINDFEQSVFALHPNLQGYREKLLASGAWWAGMSGSGSTIVGAFRDAGERDRAVNGFQNVRCLRAETT